MDSGGSRGSGLGGVEKQRIVTEAGSDLVKMSAKSSDSFSILGCFKRTFKSGQLVAPPAVEEVFGKYAENDVLTPAKFKEFLNKEQGEAGLTEEDAQRIVDEQMAHERHVLSKVKHGLTLDALLHYLLDPVGNIAYNEKVCSMMTKPRGDFCMSYCLLRQLGSSVGVRLILMIRLL